MLMGKDNRNMTEKRKAQMAQEQFDKDESGAEDFNTEGPSKSSLKREMQARQKLGEQLTQLNAKQLEQIPLNDELREALADYRRFRHREAKRRQLQFIGRLMREVEMEPLEQALQLTRAGSVAAKNLQHRLEQWRDRLIDEGDKAVNELVDQYEQIERQTLRRLIREARKQKQLNQAPMASRKLFQYLKTFITTDSLE
jgi:ribosome-associated protein